MKKQTYLTEPCGRCHNHTLLPWESHGNKTLSLCDTCGKYMGVKLYDHADGSQGYELYLHGGMALRKKVLTSKRLYEEYAALSGSRINTALDRAVKSGILTL